MSTRKNYIKEAITITDRFLAGESVLALAVDYALTRREVEGIIRRLVTRHHWPTTIPWPSKVKKHATPAR